jgi:preprotein translocase subunit SecE
MAETKSSPVDFVVEVREEMTKVTWPDWPQLKNSTFVIIVFVTIVSILILFADLIVNAGLGVLRSLFGVFGG